MPCVACSLTCPSSGQGHHLSSPTLLCFTAKQSPVRCTPVQAPSVGFGLGGGRVRAHFWLLALPLLFPSDFKTQTVFSPQPSEAAEGGKPTLAAMKKPLQLQAQLPARRGGGCGRSRLLPQESSQGAGCRGNTFDTQPWRDVPDRTTPCLGLLFFFFNYYFLPSMVAKTTL